MSSAEFSEWGSYELVEGPVSPFERADHRNAQIVAAIYNTNRDPKKQRKPFKPSDFMVDWEKEAGLKWQPDPVAVEAKIRGFFAGR